MATVSLTIPRAVVRAMSSLAANQPDAIRTYLHGVRFEVSAQTCYLIATNGHYLGAYRQTVADYVAEPVAFTAPSSLLKQIGKCKSLAGYAMTVDYDSTTKAVTIRDVANDTTISGNAIEEHFPDWRRVIPREASGKVAQFNPDYLSEFADAGREFRQGHKAFIHVHHNGDAGALVQIGVPEFIGVLMPIRSAEEFPDISAFLAADPAPVAKAA